MNDVVFRNYTRMMTRTKKLYFRGFPFPIPVAEGAIVVGGLYVYWRFLAPMIPSWIPLFGSSGIMQLLLGVVITGLLLVGFKVRTSDNRPLIYAVTGFMKSRFGRKAFNPRTGSSAIARPHKVSEVSVIYG